MTTVSPLRRFQLTVVSIADFGGQAMAQARHLDDGAFFDNTDVQ
jgi:hypothetical protein